MTICNSTECTGCGLCSIVCPKNAITMEYDEFDFLHPAINEQKCIECGICKIKCPSINSSFGYKSTDAFAAFAKDESIHKTSQSGGLAYLIERSVLNNNGIVYGQTFNENLDVTWLRVELHEQLHRLQMSKYVQGNIEGAFIPILDDLKSGNTVLFIGTPCQLAAILSFVPNCYRNSLIAVSFVCGGVASPKNLRDRIEILHTKKKLNKEQISNITFRKLGGGYYFTFFNEDKIVYEEDDFFSDFLIAYGEHLNLRESCYRCKYARPDRIGDLTIGDYLALDCCDTSLNKTDLKMGVSLAIPTTEKGKEILLNALAYMEFEERSYDDASIHNRRLVCPSERSKQVNVYRRMYTQYGFARTVHKIYWKKYYSVGYWKHKVGVKARRLFKRL